MVFRVALALQVWAPTVSSAPVEWVALTYLHVLRAERHADARRESRAIRAAAHVAVGVAEGTRPLREAHAALVARAEADERRACGAAAEAAAHADARAAAAQIEARARALGWLPDAPDPDGASVTG